MEVAGELLGFLVRGEGVSPVRGRKGSLLIATGWRKVGAWEPNNPTSGRMDPDGAAVILLPLFVARRLQSG